MLLAVLLLVNRRDRSLSYKGKRFRYLCIPFINTKKQEHCIVEYQRSKSSILSVELKPLFTVASIARNETCEAKQTLQTIGTTSTFTRREREDGERHASQRKDASSRREMLGKRGGL